MKNTLLSILVLALLTLTACKQAETEDQTETATEVEIEESKDYSATFEKRLNIMRAFIKAHSDEDIDALKSMVADSMKWSPTTYNENPWLGKEEYMAALKGYHDGYDNLSYSEGIVLPNTTGPGFFSGNQHSSDGSVNNGANAIRAYGTWHATHTATGKSIGVKWFSVTSFNTDNKIVMVTDFWDLGGLIAETQSE